MPGSCEDVDAIATAVGLPSSEYPVNTYVARPIRYSRFDSIRLEAVFAALSPTRRELRTYASPKRAEATVRRYMAPAMRAKRTLPASEVGDESVGVILWASEVFLVQPNV